MKLVCKQNYVIGKLNFNKNKIYEVNYTSKIKDCYSVKYGDLFFYIHNAHMKIIFYSINETRILKINNIINETSL